MRQNINSKTCLVTWLILLTLHTTAIASGKIIYVDDDANGLNDGTNWQNAYNYLQDALADANSSTKPVEICVAQGIYRPDRSSDEPNGSGDQEATFQLINGVTIKGGYAGYSEPDPNARNIDAYKTILSGDLAANDSPTWPYNTEENSYHVVTGSGTDANAILDGFTIIAGGYPASGGGMYNDFGSPTVINCIFSKSWASNGSCVYNYYSNPSFVNCAFSEGLAYGGGGGMYNSYSSPVLTNCTFTQNKIPGSMMAMGGGGMCNWHSSPTLTDCAFSKNQGAGYGGGMLNYYSSVTMMNCTFAENTGSTGGGLCNRESSSAKLTDCTFSRNAGGGIYNEGNSSLTLSNCIFSENSSRYDGGGVCGGALTMTNCVFTQNLAKGSGGGMCGGGTIINCRFSGNSSEYYGGGMYTGSNSTIVNCIFSGNSGGKEGGGMWIAYDTPMLTNCTFAGNMAKNGKALACAYVPLGGESGNVQGINCILWDGGDEIFKQGSSKVNITYSDIKGGWPGEGNIDKDPCFASPGYWDPNGTPEDVNDDFWVDGDYHLMSQAGRWDPNAQSWVKDNVTSPCIDAGDPMSPIGLEPFPNGGIINMGAYGGTAEASKSYFGEPVCETIVAGDINGDCVVNFKDFAIMAFHWLEEH
jgi:parallel beta-helix repeat protein